MATAGECSNYRVIRPKDAFCDLSQEESVQEHFDKARLCWPSSH